MGIVCKHPASNILSDIGFFPKQRRHDWRKVLTCLVEKYLCISGFPVVADLPRLA